MTEAQNQRMKHVTFKPWIGENYESGGIFGKKILVLGESHHCGGDSESDAEYANGYSDFTIDVVKQLLQGVKASWTPTFRKFERSLVGHETNLKESFEIWNSVAFYNYIQRALTDSRKAPEYNDKDKTAFFEVLDKYRPDLIIAWGVTRLYDNMPDERWLENDDIIIDGLKVHNGYYSLSDGRHTRIIWIRHPSSFFSWKRWCKVISLCL